MVKALIGYSFDEDISTKLLVDSIPSELFIVKAWDWQLFQGETSKATSTDPLWEIDFAIEAGGALETGTYKVQLTVTNTDDETDTTNMIIGYNKDSATIGVFVGIYDQVQAVLNGAIGMDSQEFLTFRNKWQELLGPSLGIDLLYYHHEAFWQPLQNTLIAYLIVRDSIQSSANRILSAVGGADGLVKRVETGPVNTEWFDPGSIYSDIFKPGGLWEDLAAGICGIAAKVGVYIRGCDETVPVAPQVSYGSDYAYIHQYIIAPQFQPRHG